MWSHRCQRRWARFASAAALVLGQATLAGTSSVIVLAPATPARAAPAASGVARASGLTRTPDFTRSPGAARILRVTGNPAPPAAPSSADLDRQISQASQQLEVIVEQYNATRENLRESMRQIDDVTAKLVPARQRVLDARSHLDLLLASVYKTTTAGTIGVLLGAGTPGDVLDQLATLDRMARARDDQIRALTLAQGRYDQQRRTLDALAVQQRAQQADLAGKKAAIETRIADLTRMRVAAYGSTGPRLATTATLAGEVPPPYRVDASAQAVRFAYQQLGTPYQWAGSGPGGYDCSGLTMAAWEAGGLQLPHNSVMQWGVVAHIPRSYLRPGDLVFYYSDLHHVAIYVGSGSVIHAPGYGENVTVAPLDLAPIYGYGRPH